MKLKMTLAALMLAATLAVAACGDDDDDDGGDGGGGGAEAAAAALDVTATDSAVEVSGDVAPGVVEITFQNDGKKPATAQLIRVEGDHSKAELVRTYQRLSGPGAPIPDWFRAEGGAGTTAPGQSSVVTQELVEGQYYAVNDEDDIKPNLVAAFEVTGEATDTELPSGSTVTASEYKFETAGPLPAGEPVAFENAGAEPHHLIAFRLKPGTTAQEAAKFFSEEESSGPPPIAGEPSGTSVIDGERTIVQDLALKPGNYALVCFITDRAGGPPHVAKGMISEATVE